jgi:hypothetical protein
MAAPGSGRNAATAPVSSPPNIYYDEQLYDDGVSDTTSVYSMESTHYQHRSNNHYRAEVEKRLEAKKKAEQDNLTFKPKLFAYKGSTSSSGGVSHSSQAESAARSRFDKLYEQAKASKKSKELVVVEENSFQPILVARSSSRSRRSPSPGLTRDSVQRLYEARGAGNNDQPLPDTYSFKPQITKRASSVERRHADVADRLIQKAVDIKRRHEQSKIAKENEEKSLCTFSPKLNMNSEVLSSIKQRTSNLPSEVSERLLKYKHDRGERLESLRSTKAALESSHLTFQPNLSVSRTGSRASTPTRDMSVASFHERLSEPKPVQPAVPDFPFKPTINPVSSIISSNQVLYRPRAETQ